MIWSANSQRLTNRGCRWEDYLEPGEQLLWTGVPGRGLRIRLPEDVALIPSGMVFFAFSIYFLYAVYLSPEQEVFMYIISIVLIFVCLYLVIGRFYFDAWVRSKTRYALTGARAIIEKRAVTNSIRAYKITTDTDVEFRSGRCGTIYFSKTIHQGKNEHYKKHGFEWIEDAENVCKLIIDTQKVERHANG